MSCFLCHVKGLSRTNVSSLFFFFNLSFFSFNDSHVHQEQRLSLTRHSNTYNKLNFAILATEKCKNNDKIEKKKKVID